MSTQLLLVGHGSVDQDATREFEAWVEQVRAVSPMPVHHCYIELAGPPMDQGLDACVAAGATEVLVVPCTIWVAGHTKLHIPAAIDAAKERHPGVRFQFATGLGLDPLTLQIWRDRIREVAGPPEDRSRTALLVVGRGASDSDANSDVYKLTRLLWEAEGFATADTCFIGVTFPDLPTGLRRAAALGCERVAVLPVFLFTGVLLKRLSRMVAEAAAAHPQVDLRLAAHMGLHPALAQLAIQRAAEAMAGEARMNCALCQYRPVVDLHHHHHDHDHDHDHHHGHNHHCGGKGK